MTVALWPCPLCQRPIASTAEWCPNCGLRRTPSISGQRIGAALFAVGGAVLCGVAGLMLLDVHAQDSNSLLEAIAHGLGVYCLGRAGMALSNAFR